MKTPIFQELTPTPLHERIAFAVQNAILNGLLRPGDKIAEEDLAQQFKVSRVPVREALRYLEALGLVNRQHNRGAYVRQLTFEKIKEIYEVRNRLEGLAVSLAARRATVNDIADLRAVLDDMKSAFNENRLSTMLNHDMRFHQAIWRAAKNEVLYRALEVVVIPYFAYVGSIGYASQRTIMEEVLRSHQEILNRIVQRDPIAAEGYLISVHDDFLEKLSKYSAVSLEDVDPNEN